MNQKKHLSISHYSYENNGTTKGKGKKTSIKEARRIMGDAANQYSDEEMKKIIYIVHEFVDVAYEMVVNGEI